MQLTDYHAKYFAHELTKRCPPDSVEKLAGALVDAQVDLNPHQIEAALFVSPEHPILESEVNAHKETIQQAISRRNAAIFEAEAEKLDGWADDLKVGLEQEIKELDRQIKEARRTATAALTLEDKLAGQKQVKALEQQRSAKRRALFDAQDEIDRQRERLIAEIEGKLQQGTSLIELFKVRWKLV